MGWRWTDNQPGGKRGRGFATMYDAQDSAIYSATGRTPADSKERATLWALLEKSGWSVEMYFT